MNEEEKIRYKKSLGQNFIYDKNLLRAIASDGDVGPDDIVLEIGAGAGTLTEVLAEMCREVISFEIDSSLAEILNAVGDRHSNIRFFFKDFMQADISTLSDEKMRVIANIPYYITTPIIFRLVEHLDQFKSILVLIQKEVALRFSASVGSKDYGITSVILQALFDVSIPRIVRKENFTPMPKVDSAVCKLLPHNRYDIKNFDFFKELVHLSFSMRRKTLVNNLKSKFDREVVLAFLHTHGYSDSARAEELSVPHYVELANQLCAN